MIFKLPEGSEKEALIELVNSIKKKNTVQSIVLYGSYNKGTFQKGWSDVDIMMMLKEPFDAIQFHEISRKINELETRYNVNLSVNTLLLSEVQIPTFGKPLIYLNELKNGKLLYGEYNPFKNCLIPDEETIYHNSVDNLMSIVGDSRSLLRKVGKDGDVDYYKSLLRLGVKYITFSMKRACEIRTRKFFMTHDEIYKKFSEYFPEEKDEARLLLEIRKNWTEINDKKYILDKISQCIDFVEKVWNRIHNENLSRTEYSDIEELIRIKSLPKNRESFGSDYQRGHAYRVYNMSKRLIQDISGEHKIDKDVVLLASLLHNSCKLEISENSPELNGNYARTILDGRIDEEKIEKIVYIIKNYPLFLDSGDKELEIEFKIFLDAYILDRLGYTGEVVRTLFFGDSMGRPVRESAKYYLENKNKFEKEIDALNLSSSKRIARERTERAIRFWEDLEKEYNGEL
jgi:predicted nucleotidyltransferase/HD superfamily phosphodiesterase